MSAEAPHARVTLIYDGHCGFCRKCLNWIRPRTGAFEARGFQSARLEDFGLTREQAEHEIWLFEVPVASISHHGQATASLRDGTRVTHGSRAAARLLQHGNRPALRFFGHLIDLPVVRSISQLGYQAVSRLRRYL